MPKANKADAQKTASPSSRVHKTVTAGKADAKRTILSPAVRSRHHEAIKEAVEKVVASRDAAWKVSL
jgi:hypothetical protein